MGIFKEEMDTHLDHLIESEFQIPSTFLIGKEGRKEVPPATIRLRSNSLATGRDLKGLTFVLFPVFEQVQVSSWQPIQREQQREKSPPSYLWHHHCHIKCPHGVHVGHNDGNPWVGLLWVSKCEGTFKVHLLATREKKCFTLCVICAEFPESEVSEKNTKDVYVPWSPGSLSVGPGVPVSLRKQSNELLSNYKSWAQLLASSNASARHGVFCHQPSLRTARSLLR